MRICARSTSTRFRSGSASGWRWHCANSLNPSGEPAKQRYRPAHHAQRLAVESRHPVAGTGTLGRLDVYADLLSAATCQRQPAARRHQPRRRTRSIFWPNQYSTLVAEDDARAPRRRGTAPRNRRLGCPLFLQRAAPRQPRTGRRTDREARRRRGSTRFLRRPDPEIRAAFCCTARMPAWCASGPTPWRGRSAPICSDPFRVADLDRRRAGRRSGAPRRRGGADQPDGRAARGARARRRRRAGAALRRLPPRLAVGDALVVVEAGDLPGRSALRRAFDDSPHAAAIGCYPDSAARPRRRDPRHAGRAPHRRQPRRSRFSRRASRAATGS